MRHPNLLIYNAVYGIDEMTIPSPIYDYESMYKILQPFVLTKEVYEAGVQFHKNTTTNIEIPLQTHAQIQPEKPTQTQIQTQSYLKEDPIKITLVKCNPQIPTPPPRHTRPNQNTTPFVSINSQPDPLFWCLFISMNGIKEYQYLNGRCTNQIVEEKQKLVNFIKSNETAMKPFLKKNKITGVSLKVMMSGVLSNEPVDFKNVILYCYFYKIRVTFVNFDKRVYFTVVGDEEEGEGSNETVMHYIEFSLKTTQNTAPPLVKKYKYFILTDEERIKQSNTHFKIENMEKPLNAMTTYKICELNAIAQQLGLLNGKEEGVKMKKNDVYTLIFDYFKEIL